MGKVKVIVLFLVLMSCARKAPPPSPDRWAPKIRHLEIINRRHLRVTFSEIVEPESSTEVSNYCCYETTSNVPLKILAATVRTSTETDLTTSVQSPLSYTLVISGVKDVSGNEMGIRKMEYMGSAVHDTHTPRITGSYPPDGSAGFQPDSGIIIQFSEAMDTSSVLKNCGLLPEGNLRTEWDDGMTEFRFSPEEPESGQVWGFYLKDGCRDLDGNEMEEWSFLTFTTDSVLPHGDIGGYLRSDEEGNSMIALVDSLLRIVRIAVIEDSSYGMSWLKPGTYTILAGMDVSGDRKFDLLAHDEVEIGEKRVTVDLPLEEETEKWRIFERLERIFAVD